MIPRLNNNMRKSSKIVGVYKLTCIDNGKIYIGKSVDIKNRLRLHKHSENKIIGNGYFQNAIKKYGWKSFKVEILETFDNFDKTKDNLKLLFREAYYIELFDSTNKLKGYNICKYSDDQTGIPVPDERKEKIRISNIGKKMSDENKEKLRIQMLGNTINLGRVQSEESKQKISISRIGKPRSEETKEKIRLSSKGRIVSEETKEKRRQTLLRKKLTI
jgi:group I intron endonuclease